MGYYAVTPDSWIESSQNGMCPDDAGDCPFCGEHLDSGRCDCDACPECEMPAADCECPKDEETDGETHPTNL